MRLQISFALLLLLAMVVFAGCYTQLGHHASSDFGRVHHKHYEGLREKETAAEHAEEAESEASELTDTDDEDSEGYYGRRKRSSYRTTYTQSYRYDTYWSPYIAYPSYAYPPVWYYPYRPFYWDSYYYGYHAPYYRYYRGYYPYRNVYRRYHGGGSRYTPLSRRTYKKGDGRLENRRSRSSRGVTSPSPRSRSERQRIRDRNKK